MMRKARQAMAVAAMAMTVISCSTGQRIARAYHTSGQTVNLRQPTSSEKNMETDTAGIMPEMIKFTDKDGQEKTVLSSVLDTVTGSYELAVSLGEVTVVSKSRVLPERNGVITLPFVITIPKEFLESDWRITVTPTLDNDGEKTDLRPIVVTGRQYHQVAGREGMFRQQALLRAARLDERQKEREEYFGGEPEKSDLRKAYEEYLEARRMEGKDWVLDSISDNREMLEYHYRQEFMTRDFARRLRLTVSATIEDIGHARQHLSEGDTLTYILSSMTQYLDRSTRYIRQTLYRKVTEDTKAFITFPVGSHQVIDTLGNNATELAGVRAKMNEINHGNEFVIDSVIISAGSSPEGAYLTNRELSKARGQALKEYLRDVLESNAEAEALVQVRQKGEDWKSLTDHLAKSRLDDKAEILAIIREESDEDAREARIRNEHPESYTYMKDSIYPALRAVDFVYHLSRRGMVEDVTYTTTPDTEYEKALELMDAHRYSEAMPKMLEYKDVNAAICYMSLGYDKAALDILAAQESNSDIEYLKAILLSRMGRTEEAVAAFISSCQMDYSKMNKGELDPEISKLITAYRLSEMEF
ncbi:MAG: hypothetical protein IJR07_06870 [Bacteroidaceae bacterium]|nr:hypothetical protein [Bacteroidaceae bacterium]